MNFLVLGAGPAGLTFANILKQNNIDFLVLEKEDSAGGLCRSININGSPLDIGGGHFLDVRNKEVLDFLFKFMPEEEWNKFDRVSKINVENLLIDYPFESSIWQLDINKQVDYIKSIAYAGCNLNHKKPYQFKEWIEWKLGNLIAKNYMLPYNEKLFGVDLNELGTYWLDKLPNVSLDETIRSCLVRKQLGTIPAHGQFYYPKEYGYGEVWKRMALKIENNIKFNKRILELDIKNRTVKTDDGIVYSADCIISTIPWSSISKINHVDLDFLKAVRSLKTVPIAIDYYEENYVNNAHWIYLPDKKLPYHRVLNREMFCLGSKGFWTERNANRELKGFKPYFTFLNPYAYPINTIEKENAINYILETASKSNIYGLGRWGEHQHYNSDVTVQRAMNLAHDLIKWNK